MNRPLNLCLDSTWCHPDRREACPPRRGSAFSFLTAHHSLHLPLHSFVAHRTISHFGPLCFQELAHSSAIRWGWGGGVRFSYFQFRVSFLDPLYLLSLPLLRKLPGVSHLFPKRNSPPDPRSDFSRPQSAIIFCSPLTTRHSPLPPSQPHFPFLHSHAIVLAAGGISNVCE
jgi:hypothetical protein